MLTPRGWWFLTFVLTLLLLTVWTRTPSVALVCLTLLSWFVGVWLFFVVRLRLLTGRLRVERAVLDEHGPVEGLWAGRSFTVRARLVSEVRISSPYLRATDRVPFSVRRIAGEAERDGTVARGRPLEVEYQVFCPAPGRVRFEGIEVHLADPQGFFHHALFVQDVHDFRVLPALADARDRVHTVKRHNALPLLGVHRHRRPGTGSELLDLRDYLPGDPPKMIAWKASARRDRLMTKEFESEVPIRCTLFVDTSNSVRVGPPGQNPLARLVEITAAVAQAAARARDLPGLCLFDEAQVSYTRPARGQRHLVGLLNELADAAGLPATAAAAPVEPLLPLAAGLAEEVYPELMRPELNQVPFWLPWLWPLPAHPRGPKRRSGVYLALFLLLALVPVAALGLFVWVLLSVVFEFFTGIHRVLGLAAVTAMAVAVVTINYARLEFAYRALPQIFSTRRRRHARWRKRLAALLSVRYQLAPGGLAALMEQDGPFALYLQRFLAEHQIPYELPLYDARGRYLFAAPAKVEVLAGALLRAVGRGHDNELFVLLADLLELDDRLAPLLSAVKVAVARHHQVMVVCPWPPGVPLPRKPGERRGPSLATLDAPLAVALRRAAVLRFHRAYYRVRRTFARLGVLVLCARDEDSVRLILERLERLRTQEKGGAMTPPPEEQPELPFLNTYTVLCLAALVALLLIEVQHGTRLTTPVLVAIGLAGVLTRLRAGPVLLLVTVAAGHLIEQQRLTGFGWYGHARPRAFAVGDVVLCGAVLLYIAAHYRLQALTRHVFLPDPRRREPVPGRPGKTRMVRHTRSPGLATPEEAAFLVLLVPVPALLAQALWLAVARPWSVLGLPGPVGRILLLGWVLAVGAFLLGALLGHWRTRQMNADEGELHLQDTLWRETRREQRRLNRWLAWAEQRRRRKEQAS